MPFSLSQERDSFILIWNLNYFNWRINGSWVLWVRIIENCFNFHFFFFFLFTIVFPTKMWTKFVLLLVNANLEEFHRIHCSCPTCTFLSEYRIRPWEHYFSTLRPEGIWSGARLRSHSRSSLSYAGYKINGKQAWFGSYFKRDLWMILSTAEEAIQPSC